MRLPGEERSWLIWGGRGEGGWRWGRGDILASETRWGDVAGSEGGGGGAVGPLAVDPLGGRPWVRVAPRGL